MKMWEKCPLCEGTGKINSAWLMLSAPVPDVFSTDGKVETCPCCKGRRIINSQTGFPPNDDPVVQPNVIYYYNPPVITQPNPYYPPYEIICKS